MKLNKPLSEEDMAKKLMHSHYLATHKFFMHYDMICAKTNALISINHIVRSFEDTHRKLVAGGLLKEGSSVEDTSTYKYWQRVKEIINNFEVKELT